MSSAFGTNDFPSKVEDLHLENNWVPLYLDFPVSSDFKTCLKKIKSNFTDNVGSSKILGTNLLIYLMMLLPFNLASLTYSNLAK